MECCRDIVFSSRDGIALLWDCSQQQNLAVWEDPEAGIINGCALDMPTDEILTQPDSPTGGKGVGTDDKLLL